MTSASDLMSPLGVYKEVGKGLSESSNLIVKEATVGWLAAAQVSFLNSECYSLCNSHSH